MFGLIATVGVAGAVAGFVYLARERQGVAGAGMAALRTAAFAGLIVLLANPIRERVADATPPTVLLDASLSLDAAGGRWAAVLDTARSVAGEHGTILRFAAGVEPFDTGPPVGGRTLLDPALRAAAGRGGPTYVVTDGEIADLASVPAVLGAEATFVVLPRDTVADAALLQVVVPSRMRQRDSLPITLEIGTWGPLSDSVGTIEIETGGRVVLRRTVRIPPPPGAARRTVHAPAGLLAPGTHVLAVRLTVAGDREPRDDVRLRAVTISELPAVTLVARPADWESRFLMRELIDVTGAAVNGYAELGPGRWVDMETLLPVSVETVRTAARAAALLVTRGAWTADRPGQPRWHWPSAGGDVRFARGDWYPVAQVPASPLAGPLGLVEWDSLPPLTGIVPIAPVDEEWVGLSARLGRRGAERPALVGRDSAGARELTTAAGGLWRWALRGGASREAYRATVAAGVDWLLASHAVRRRAGLTVREVVPFGLPLVFLRAGQARRTSLDVRFTGPDSTFVATLRFDDRGRASLVLPPGVYRWQVSRPPAATGLAIVESYSPEVPPGPVTALAAGSLPPGATLLVAAREHWWVFVLVAAALVGEWAWRTRRGLP